MKKILWFSRHPLTREQDRDLRRIYGEHTVIHINRTIQHAVELINEIEYCDVIAIVAPFHLEQEFLENAGNKPVIFTRTKRIQGYMDKPEFVFNGWYRIKRMYVQIEKL